LYKYIIRNKLRSDNYGVGRPFYNSMVSGIDADTSDVSEPVMAGWNSRISGDLFNGNNKSKIRSANSI